MSRAAEGAATPLNAAVVAFVLALAVRGAQGATTTTTNLHHPATTSMGTRGGGGDDLHFFAGQARVTAPPSQGSETIPAPPAAAANFFAEQARVTAPPSRGSETIPAPPAAAATASAGRGYSSDSGSASYGHAQRDGGGGTGGGTSGGTGGGGGGPPWPGPGALSPVLTNTTTRPDKASSSACRTRPASAFARDGPFLRLTRQVKIAGAVCFTKNPAPMEQRLRQRVRHRTL